MDKIGLNSLSEEVPELMSTDPIRSMFELANERASIECNFESCSEFTERFHKVIMLSAKIYSSVRTIALS